MAKKMFQAIVLTVGLCVMSQNFGCMAAAVGVAQSAWNSASQAASNATAGNTRRQTYVPIGAIRPNNQFELSQLVVALEEGGEQFAQGTVIREGRVVAGATYSNNNIGTSGGTGINGGTGDLGSDGFFVGTGGVGINGTGNVGSTMQTTMNTVRLGEQIRVDFPTGFAILESVQVGNKYYYAPVPGKVTIRKPKEQKEQVAALQN